MPKRKYESLGKYVAKRRKGMARKTTTTRRFARTRRSLNYRTGGFLGIEKKFLDGGLPPTALVNAGSGSTAGCEFDPATMLCLSAPGQGDGQSQREGREISADRIDVNGLIIVPAAVNQAAQVAPPEVRVYLIEDSQSNGAQLNSEDVFVSPFASTANGVLVFRNLEYAKRFRVKASAHICCEPGMPTYDGTNIEISGRTYEWKMSTDLKGKRITFNTTGTTATIASVTDVSYHVVAFTSTVANAPTIAYNARFRFRG